MLHELYVAARSLRRSPHFAVVVIVILALGIGANATLFAIADAVLFRPFPFTDQRRLVIGGENASDPRSEISYRAYRSWRQQARTFESLAVIGSTNWTLHLKLRDDLVAIRHRSVSANFFDVLGTKPLLGRAFDGDEDRRGAARTVVLSYGLWQRQFGGDPHIVGRLLTMNEGAFTVVGVMPAAFRYPAGAEAWTPVVADLAAVPPSPAFEKLEDSDVGMLYIVGRLAPNATLNAARLDLNRAIDQQARATNRGRRVESRLTLLVDDILGSSRTSLWMLIAAMGLLLLVACANVAGLLLARAASRRHEFAVRLALGASRRALAWQLLCESLLLALVATIGAALASLACVPAVRAWIPGELPRIGDAVIGGRTLLFTAAIGVAAGVISWIVPAIQSARDLEPALRRSGHTVVTGGLRQPLRRALIVGELAVAVVLLTAAALMLRSLISLSRLDLGFDARELFAITMSGSSAAETTAETRASAAIALRELAAIPGVVSVGGASNRPLLGVVGSDSPVRLEAQSIEAAGRNPFVNLVTITPDYFPTLRTRLAGGRFFTDDDRATSQPVIIVSEGFAKWAWPGASPIGKRLQVTALNIGRRSGPIWWTVVGVAADSRNREITRPAFDVYAPFAQSPYGIETLVARTSGNAAAMAPVIRQRLRALNPNRLISIEAMTDVVSAHEAPWRANLALFAAFAALTALIAVAGLYALMAHTIVEQSREIGVRLVLGATPQRVAGGVIVSALSVIAVGGAIGLGAAAMMSQLLRSLLFGIQPLDPMALLVSPFLLAMVALAACVWPAVKAARTDPAACLRSE